MKGWEEIQQGWLKLRIEHALPLEKVAKARQNLHAGHPPQGSFFSSINLT